MRFFECIAGLFPDVKFVATGYLGEEDLKIVSGSRIAAEGGYGCFREKVTIQLSAKKKSLSVLTAV